MPASEHFIYAIYSFAANRRTSLVNSELAVCFEAYIEKVDDGDEMLILIIKGTHIHSTRVSQVKKRISYAQLLSASAPKDLCRHIVNEAFDEIEIFLINDLRKDKTNESKM